MEVGILGDVLDDSCHCHVRVIQLNDFSKSVFIAKDFLCQVLGQNDRVAVFQSSFRVAFDKRELKNFKESWINRS